MKEYVRIKRLDKPRMTSLLLSQKQWERVKDAAEMRGISMAELIRQALRHYLGE